MRHELSPRPPVRHILCPGSTKKQSNLELLPLLHATNNSYQLWLRSTLRPLRAANEVAFFGRKAFLTDEVPQPWQPTTEEPPDHCTVKSQFRSQYFPNNACDRPSLRAPFFSSIKRLCRVARVRRRRKKYQVGVTRPSASAHSGPAVGQNTLHARPKTSPAAFLSKLDLDGDVIVPRTSRTSSCAGVALPLVVPLKRFVVHRHLIQFTAHNAQRQTHAGR